MGNIDMQSVIRRIELRIAEMGMSKKDFYKLSGISSANYSQWNTGTHKPTKKKLSAAAKTLNLSLEYLLYGEETDKKTPVPNTGDERDNELMRLIQLCTPEIKDREIAYLKSLLGETDI